jgi:hypothetical protein
MPGNARQRGLLFVVFALATLLDGANAVVRRRKQPIKFDNDNDIIKQQEVDDADLIEQRDLAADPRFLFANFTSSLITVNTTLLAYGLIALGLLVAAALAIYYLWVEATSRSSSYGNYGGGGSQYGAPAVSTAGFGQGYGYQQYARYLARGSEALFFLSFFYQKRQLPAKALPESNLVRIFFERIKIWGYPTRILVLRNGPKLYRYLIVNYKK